MEQRRFLLFFSLSMLLLIGWYQFVAPRFFPAPPRKPAVAQKEAGQKDTAANDPAGQAVDLTRPAQADKPLNVGPAAVAAAQAEKPAHPRKEIVLGSNDPDSPYFLNVELTTQGAAVERITLNDPRYKRLDDAKAPLAVVGSDDKLNLHTLSLTSPEIDATLLKSTGSLLNTIDWEVVPGSQTASSVRFRLKTPDGRFELLKTYTLPALLPDQLKQPNVRDDFADGYKLKCELVIRNLLDEQQTVSYRLQGPAGLPLEDSANVQKFRDVRLGFLGEDGRSVDGSQLPAGTVVSTESDGRTEKWQRPLSYIGIDTTYFVALLRPLENQVKNRTLDFAEAFVTTRAPEPHKSDVAVVLQSKEFALAPASAGKSAEIDHTYELYAGPKRKHLLATMHAEQVVENHVGWNPFFFMEPLVRALVVPMLWLLNTLHSVGVNYGIAIILLTIMVRTALMPLTRKQAQSAQRMKEMQPQLKELQKKHAGNREALQRAQLELYSKHGFNPLAGCWPILLQMPIFFALYRALSVSVDLRRASFLWIDNLAAPDALFPLGFTVPFLGWTEFNLLPLLTIALFIVQQKVLLPPPADAEQEMQYKMMNFMMIFMGAMFYRVPAGLCIYFITSSIWGMVERWFFGKWNTWYPPKPVAPKPKRPSMFGKMWEQALEAADKQAEQARQQVPTNPRPVEAPGSNPKKKNKRR